MTSFDAVFFACELIHVSSDWNEVSERRDTMNSLHNRARKAKNERKSRIYSSYTVHTYLPSDTRGARRQRPESR